MNSLNDKKDCMGCYACSNICPVNCISMVSDTEGFWYPQVDYDKCIKCDQCRKICPILSSSTSNSTSNVPSAYACINNEEAVRLESSSGGMFTLIAEQVIENGGVVFGAGYNDDFTIEHSFIETKEELSKFRGSKYVQSRIGNTYSQVKDFLKSGRSVLFTGTPCQIGGLKAYLGQFYDKLICVDIICHGVPSPEVWMKYVSYREQVAGLSAQRISFRRKDEGWKRYSMSFIFKDDIEYRKTFDKDIYMKTFLKDICLRPSCYACKFKTIHRQSDITLADFWGIKSILPEMDDDKGTSLIFVNTSKGREVFSQIENKMKYKKVNLDQAIEFNPAAIRCAKSNRNRKKFFDGLDKIPFDQLVKKYCTDKYSIRVKRKVKIVTCKILEKMGLLGIIKQVLRKVKLENI